MDLRLIGSSSPHIKDKVTTSRVMLDVIIALLPAALMGVILFGWQHWLILLFQLLPVYWANTSGIGL